MKRFISALLALALFAGTVGAQELRSENFGGHLGSARADTMVWFASGLIPGSVVKVDTFIAGTLQDTTYPIAIAGASQVAINFVAADHGTSINSAGALSVQVSADKAKTAIWHSLSTAFTVSTSTADTTLYVALNNTVPDSVFTAQTGMTAATHGDQAYVRSNRFLRLIYNPNGQGVDTTEVTAVITRIYPR